MLQFQTNAWGFFVVSHFEEIEKGVYYFILILLVYTNSTYWPLGWTQCAGCQDKPLWVTQSAVYEADSDRVHTYHTYLLHPFTTTWLLPQCSPYDGHKHRSPNDAPSQSHTCTPEPTISLMCYHGLVGNFIYFTWCCWLQQIGRY